MASTPPDSATALAAAACFVLHGANATRIALGHHPVGVVRSWWPAWSFLFLSAQGNLIVLVYGLMWLLEICIPGSTVGLLYLSAHLVSGLALQVFLLYYAFCHFHKEGYEGLKQLEARGELLYNGDVISAGFFARTQNYMHAPLLPLAGLPLIAIDREELIAGMMGLAGTFVCALSYFCCYAALVLGIKYFSNIWIYPFMSDFTRVWHHAAFYAFAFGLYLLLVLGYRACAEGTRGLVDEGQVVVAASGIVVALGIALSHGSGEGARPGRRGSSDADPGRGYKPLPEHAGAVPRGVAGA